MNKEVHYRLRKLETFHKQYLNCECSCAVVFNVITGDLQFKGQLTIWQPKETTCWLMIIEKDRRQGFISEFQVHVPCFESIYKFIILFNVQNRPMSLKLSPFSK